MIDFKILLKDLYYFGPTQKYINRRWKDPTKVIIDRSVVKYIVTPEGLIFPVSDAGILHQVIWEYRFDDLKPDDVVLDLGANIGAFSLRAAQKCKHVYAVEPLYTDELKENIARNNLQDKISVIPYGIGYGEKIPIKYLDRVKEIQTYPLSEILKITGPISFMKCDIEGAEWTIQPEDIAGIPRMEFEVHEGCDSCMPEKPELLEYIRKNWRTETNKKILWYPGCYIHAYPV